MDDAHPLAHHFLGFFSSRKWPPLLVSLDTNPYAPTYVLAVSSAPLHEKDTGAKGRVLAEASSVQKTEIMKSHKADIW